MNNLQPIIRTENLHKHFGALHVLKGVSESIMPNEAVTVIGPSAAARAPFCAASTCWRCPKRATFGLRA